MTVFRVPHKFDNLNWVVSVISEGEPFINLKGDETFSFNFCTIPENPFYFQLSEIQNYIDQDLRIESIQNKFSGGPHKNALAPIPATSFSITNLELFYHQLSEINGDDLNVFEGARIEIWMVNGLNPLVVWDDLGQVWNKFDNTLSPIQDQRPTILTPDYPTNEKGYLVFTGTIEDIGFSTATTNFDCLGVADKINVSLGNLVDPLAQKKDRGGIFPLTFGNWSLEDDLMPVILNRNQNQVPRIILGEYPHNTLDVISLYDKVSERDFTVKNKFVVDADKNSVSFISDQPTEELGTNLTADKTTYNEGQAITSLRNDLFQNPYSGTVATEQALYDVDGENIAFHTPSNNPTPIFNTFYGDIKGQISASRAWGDQPAVAHIPESELFEVDQDYQKAIALIDISPKIVGLFWSDKGLTGPTSTEPCGKTTGNFWNMIERVNADETDLAPDLDSFAYCGGSNVLFGSTDFFSFEFEKIGLVGEILKTTIDHSAWFYGGNDDFSTKQQFGIAISVKDLGGSREFVDQSRIIYQTDIQNQDVNFLDSQIKGVNTPLTPTELLGPSRGWMKIKINADLTTPDLTNIDQINEGRLGIQCSVAANDTKHSSRCFFDYMNWEFRVRVDADNGLWFAKGSGRLNGSSQLIKTSTEAIQDIMEKELKYNPSLFGSITSNRDNFPCAFSIFGKQKKWRDELKKICFSFGMGSFQSFDGKENLIDFDRRTPDFEIAPDMVLLSGGLQAINYSFTDRGDLFNEFLIKFKVNPANNDTQSVLLLNEDEIQNTEPVEFLTAQQVQALQAKVSRATKRLGFTNNEKKQFLLKSDYFRNGETAERMLNLFVLWNTSTKVIVNVSGTYSDFFDFEIGFQGVFKKNAFGGLPKKVADSQYLVIGKTINPPSEDGGSINLEMIEIPTDEV